jgi:hypothetical protein
LLTGTGDAVAEKQGKHYTQNLPDERWRKEKRKEEREEERKEEGEGGKRKGRGKEGRMEGRREGERKGRGGGKKRRVNAGSHILIRPYLHDPKHDFNCPNSIREHCGYTR